MSRCHGKKTHHHSTWQSQVPGGRDDPPAHGDQCSAELDLRVKRQAFDERPQTILEGSRPEKELPIQFVHPQRDLPAWLYHLAKRADRPGRIRGVLDHADTVDEIECTLREWHLID